MAETPRRGSDEQPRLRAPSVKRQLVVLVGTLVVLACLGLTVVGYVYTRNILEEATRDRLVWQAAVRAEDVASWVERQRGNVALVSSRTRLRQLLRPRSDAAGQRRAAMEAAHILWDARDATPSFREIWIVDPEGRIVAATDTRRLGESADPALAHILERASRRAVVGFPQRTPAGVQVVAAGPVLDRQRHLLGTVLIRIDANRITRTIGAQGVGPAAGRIVVAAMEDGTWRSLFHEAQHLPPAALLERAAAGESGFAHAEDDAGNQHLVAFAPIRSTNWALAADTTSDRAYAPVTRLRTLAIGVALVVLLVGILGAMLVARRFTRPLRRLVTASREIAAGKLTARAIEDGPAEFAQLARAFNEMAEALTDHTAHLDELVRKRTDELQRSEWELRGALRDARRAERARRAFLAAVSHDIRSPVSAVLGMAEVLMLEPASESQRRDLAAMHAAATSLLALLDDILDFSRLEAGAVTIEAAPFSLREALSAAVQQHARAAYEKGLELTLFIDPTVPEHLVGDAGRLRQIVGNQIGNAVKFTSEGDVRVEVPAARHGARHDARLSIVVEDTGPGVALEHREQIFDAFEQGSSKTWHHHGGSGLGLAICRHLAGLMGGLVTVGGEPGRGARFTLELPMIEPPHLAEPHARPLDGVPVLVALQHVPSRRALRALLERDGARVKTLADLAGARAALEDGAEAKVLIAERLAFEAETAAALRDLVRRRGLAPVLLVRPGPTERLPAPAGGALLEKPLLQVPVREAIQGLLGRGAARPRETVRPVETEARREVLVVDDSDMIRDVVTRVLRGRGHTVRTAADGEEALADLAARPADVVLMDLHMPGLGGLEAARAIRERGLPCGRLIALSAHAATDDHRDVTSAGFDGFLQKPAPMGELVATVEGEAPRPRPEAREARVPVREPSEPDTDAPVFDLERALAQVGSKKMLAHLAPSLRSSVGELLGTLREAVSKGDASAAALAAHTLAGSLDMFGATRAAQTARALASRLRAGTLAGAESRIETLEKAVGEVFREVASVKEPAP